MGTTGGLAALFVLAMAAQVSIPLLGSGLLAWTSGVKPDASGPHDVLLDDLLSAGLSPDGVAAREGTFRELVSGSDRDRLEFVADVDGDGTSDRIRYEVRDGALVRLRFRQAESGWTLAASDVIARDVEQFRVAFLDRTRSRVPAEEVRARGAHVAHVSLRVGRGAAGTPTATLSGEVVLPHLAG